MADPGAAVDESWRGDILKGTLTLKTKGYRTVFTKKESGAGEGDLYFEGRPGLVPAELTFVPYAYWGNRTPGEMLVWVRALITED